MRELIPILIWILCGSAMAMSFVILWLYRYAPFFYRLLLRTCTGMLLIMLIGSARIENITDPVSVRGMLGLLAIVLVLVDLVWEAKLYLRKGET